MEHAVCHWALVASISIGIPGGAVFPWEGETDIGVGAEVGEWAEGMAKQALEPKGVAGTVDTRVELVDPLEDVTAGGAWGSVRVEMEI